MMGILWVLGGGRRGGGTMEMSLARWSGGTQGFLGETFYLCVRVSGGESVLTGIITGSSGHIKKKR